MSKNSEAYRLLEKYVAGGSSTGSKRATLMPEEPTAITYSKGCRVWDADGKEYLLKQGDEIYPFWPPGAIGFDFQ